MKLSDFDYELPQELIAQFPPKLRDESRLIVLDRRGEDIRETLFSNFPRFLQEGDILVVNETRVIPARIFGKRKSGGQVEVFLVRRLSDRQWVALLRPASKLSTGETVLVGESDLGITLGSRLDEGKWRVRLPDSIEENKFIETYGHVPLPPYIKREDQPHDRERYQTVYARRDGSVAAPTAGLHFTEEVLHDVKRRGVTIIPVTLHVGPGTFRPLTNEIIEENKLDPEFVIVKKENRDEIMDARRSLRRIVAVGTTTMRVLESLAMGPLANQEERIIEDQTYLTGTTDLFIGPGFKFRIVDALLTNLHLPRSSLLVLVAAFAGREKILNAYSWAISRKYRFYSYGDVMFIR
ncbi:MAG: tRNA preQ1(34) S-adenosylmethionine ribosyltransferase-isomerase QueA [Candidatus Krumholzibacteria bacterium]|nr:tRNA preQ1(34) S-adenosylmethionine ribosyltransferase-isomerase QueA [Candidatus Krumholzibacteria bacterium]